MNATATNNYLKISKTCPHCKSKTALLGFQGLFFGLEVGCNNCGRFSKPSQKWAKTIPLVMLLSYFWWRDSAKRSDDAMNLGLVIFGLLALFCCVILTLMTPLKKV
jgi:hypothetical protein